MTPPAGEYLLDCCALDLQRIMDLSGEHLPEICTAIFCQYLDFFRTWGTAVKSQVGDTTIEIIVLAAADLQRLTMAQIIAGIRKG